ncbi:unnamed protein product [Psylliodes chrysocephalus]|uniref:Protein takeout-like n=1 Tax=Psylliodes chrysocephalus TaxID=3402493 RepID=A0A9P0D2P8_9CUCU|nr:unnamed protein product [Psylliodes chrysocephala]
MKMYAVLAILQIFVVCAFSTTVLPSYIKPCSRSDPNFDKCCLEHGIKALPYIFKGDRKMGIPNMLPLVIPQIDVKAGNNLKIYLKHVHVFGLDTTILKDVKIDIDHSTIKLDVDIPMLDLRGKYEIEGHIMVLPIRGKGDMNITALGGQYSYNLEYGIENINGLDYLQLTDKDKLDFKLEGVKFNLDNLFDGDKIMGDQMNLFLNENWRDVLDEFGLTISETVRSVGKSIASAYFKKVPYHTLILD